jgi:hypothetical protein
VVEVVEVELTLKQMVIQEEIHLLIQLHQWVGQVVLLQEAWLNFKIQIKMEKEAMADKDIVI